MLSFPNMFFTSHRSIGMQRISALTIGYNRFTWYQKLRPEDSGDHGVCPDTLMDEDTDHISLSDVTNRELYPDNQLGLESSPEATWSP